MAGVSVKLVGMDAALRKLRTLPKKVQGKIIRPALRAAAKIGQTEARRLAPIKGGLLRKNIRVRAAKRKRGRIGVVFQNIGGDYKGETYYAAFQEFGYRIGPRKLGTARTEVPGKHFMEQAGKNKEKAMVQTVQMMMEAGVIQEAKKA